MGTTSAEPPGRNTGGKTVEARNVAIGSGLNSSGVGRYGQRNTKIAPLGHDHLLKHVEGLARGENICWVGGDICQVEHLGGRASVTSTTSAGPPPSKTAIDSLTSTALPAARPSTVSIRVMRAVVATPWEVPISTIVSASRRACSSSGRKAPDPTFTSSTRASVPSAIFFDIIELAIKGSDATVPVASRRA